MIPLLITENINDNMKSWIRPENPILDARSENRQRIRHLDGDSFLSGELRRKLCTELSRQVFYCRKAVHTLTELLNQRVNVLLMHERFWLSFEPRFRLCFEHYQTLEMKKYICKWWVKITRRLIHTGRIQPVTEMVKSYMLRLKRHFFGFEYPVQSLSDLRKSPINRAQPLDGLPRFPEGTWMSKRPQDLTRDERSLACSFISTRSLPHADGQKIQESLEKHYTVLHDRPEDLGSYQDRWLREKARIAALELFDCYSSNYTAQTTVAHISITNSATYEKSRTAGGRAEYVRSQFWDYIKGYYAPGEPFFELSSFDDYEDSELIRAYRVGGLNPRFGLTRELNPALCRLISTDKLIKRENDSFFDMLILMSFKDLMDNGYVEEDCGFLERTDKPFPMKRTAICEPGGKARIVTQTPAALTTIGQPIQHVLKEVLAADPTLRAGLGAAAQSFEIHKRLNFVNKHPKGDMFFGDFEEATDFINWEIYKTIFEEFAEVFDIGPNTWVYFYLHDLLPSPCVMEGVDTEPTERGLLMGLPGTKFALHLINKVINVIVRGIEKPRRYVDLLSDPFGAAGDDIFDIDIPRPMAIPAIEPYTYMDTDTGRVIGYFTVGERYQMAAYLLGMKMSDQKSGVFRYGGPYCEVPILDTDFSYKPWENKGGFQDVVRLRLLSAETKQGKGDSDTNPLVGKAFQFQKELMWQPDIFRERKKRARYSFFVSFRKYIDRYDFHLELHPFLGGLGLQSSSDEELYDNIPVWYKRLIGAYLDLGDPIRSRKAVRVFHQWTSDRLARGVKIEYDTELEDALSPLAAYSDVGTALWDVFKTSSAVRKAWEAGNHDEGSLRSLIKLTFDDDLTPIKCFLIQPPAKEARYVDKVKYLRNFGIIPIRDMVRELSGGDFWDQSVSTCRGFETMTIQEKTEAQIAFMDDYFNSAPIVTKEDFLKLQRTLRSKDEFVNTHFLHIHSFRRMEVVVPPAKLERYARVRIRPEFIPPSGLPQLFGERPFIDDVEPGFFVDLRSTRTARITLNQTTKQFLNSKQIMLLSGFTE